MEYVLLFFFAWVVVCLPAIIYTAVANSRRRNETAQLNDRITTLSRQLENLEHRMRVDAAQASHPSPAPQAAPAPPIAAAPLPAMRISVEETRSGAPSRPVVAPAHRPAAIEKPETTAVPPPPPPMMPPAAVPPAMELPVEADEPAAPAKKRKASLEDIIGANWLPKLAVTIIVIGVGFLIAAKWMDFSAWHRVLIVYSGAAVLLGGGIYAERKEIYRTAGRALIGGGWAVTVVVTYALGHADSMRVVPSNAADMALLLVVVAAMVWHTLRFNSQLVTGAGFLLGFAAITLNPDPPYNLIAGALLVAGMTVVVHRYRWWELEVFGILASYLNHGYWLFSNFGFDSERGNFQYDKASVLLAVSYWAVFRFSYMWREPAGREEESVSTVAGLLNPLLLLAVLKYEFLHPKWMYGAFYGLLGLGAMEFALGQLPRSRRRIAPFRVLSSLGAALMVAAVPFRYSGDALEILWLAGAEAFLLAGVFLKERLFRGFGLIVSALIVLYALPYRIAPLAEKLIDGEPHSDPQLAMVLAAIAAVLYANSHVVRARWPELFRQEPESHGLKILSFAASALVVSAIYAFIHDAGVAIVLALFVGALTLLGNQFAIDELIYQGHWVTVAAFIQTISNGMELEAKWHGIADRILVVVPVAGLLYLSSRHVRLSRTNYNTLFSAGYTWAGSLLLGWLLWYQLKPINVSLAWAIFGLLLFEVGSWRSLEYLRAQAYVALAASFVHIFYTNVNELGAGSFGPAAINVALLAPVYFWVYWQLHGRKPSPGESKMRVEYLLACLGTATLAVLARFELPADTVVVGYAAIMLAALLVAWFTRLNIFLFQALALLGVAAFRMSMQNFYRLDEAISFNLRGAVLALALMAAGVPLCLLVRRHSSESATGPGWIRALARRPEQPMFFVPFMLLAVLLYLKVVPGMVTLAWGAEATVVYVLALWAKERNFRLAGLGLLLLCAAKVICWDAWQMGDLTARYLTLIGVGALMFVISFLYSRNREALRDYL